MVRVSLFSKNDIRLEFFSGLRVLVGTSSSPLQRQHCSLFSSNDVFQRIVGIHFEATCIQQFITIDIIQTGFTISFQNDIVLQQFEICLFVDLDTFVFFILALVPDQ